MNNYSFNLYNMSYPTFVGQVTEYKVSKEQEAIEKGVGDRGSGVGDIGSPSDLDYIASHIASTKTGMQLPENFNYIKSGEGQSIPSRFFVILICLRSFSGPRPLTPGLF